MMERPIIRLADLCDLVREPVKPGDRPNALYLGLEHLAPARLVRIGGVQASEIRSTTSAFRPNDVLYGKLRPYLDKAVLADKPGICTTELLVLRAKAHVDPRFLAVVVHSPSFLEHAVAGTTGVQHPRTSWAHTCEFEVPAFTLDEQQRIAGLLWFVHEAIGRSEALIEQGQVFKRTVAQMLFTCGLQGERQKETKIGPMPESWESRRLGDYADIMSTPMAYSELEERDQVHSRDSVRVLGIKVADMNLPGNEIELRTATLEMTLDKVTAEKRCAPPRTIIFPKRGAAIATNKKRISTTWTTFDPNVIGIIAAEHLEQNFLFQWFQLFDLRTITEPGPTPQLNKKNLIPLNIPVPPTLREQQEIVAILGPIDRKIGIHRQKRAVLQELSKALLHKLITGEIRVKELNLEGILSGGTPNNISIRSIGNY